MILSAVILILVGLAIGILGGMLGVGGGTIIVPVLRLGFGLEPIMATATSLFTIIFTSIGGTTTHVKNKTCVPKLGLALGIGGAITSAVGVYLGSISPGWLVMAVAAVIILYSGYNMLKKALKLPKTPKAATVGGAAPEEPTPEYEVTFKRLAAGFGIGLIAGLASGYVGVGGGFIMVPLMTSWLAVPMKKASGTSLIAIMLLCIPGTIENIIFGSVDFLAGISLVIGSIPGAMLGARLVKRVPERKLRFIFAGLLAVSAIMLVLKEFM